MFLGGILFMGLNFIAFVIVNPNRKESKRIGYALFIAVFLVLLIQQEYQAMTQLGFTGDSTREILLGGLVLPVFVISIVYYRVKRSRLEKKQKNPIHPEKQ
jgi:protein-S-isoprenylcysteine O-methyltransferase Ste14